MSRRSSAISQISSRSAPRTPSAAEIDELAEDVVHQSRRSSNQRSQGSLRNGSVSSNKTQISPMTKVFDGKPIVDSPTEIISQTGSFYGAGGSVSGESIKRQSTSDSVSSSLRKVSEIVSDAAQEAVAVITSAKQSWIRFIFTWASRILVICTLVLTSYVGTKFVMENDIDWKHITLRELSDQFGGHLAQRLKAGMNELDKAHEEYTLTTNLQLNFTTSMEPLWNEYSRLATNTDYEIWFVDARDADDVITAMYNTLPAPEGDNATRSRAILKGYMYMRSTMRKRAEVHFENFLSARVAVLDTMLSEARKFQWFLDWQLNGAEKPRWLDTDYQKNQKIGEVISHGVLYSPANRTSSILNHAAETLLTNLLTAHGDLFVPVQDPVVIVPERRLMGIGDLELAEDTEKKILTYLRNNSPLAGMWRDRHDESLNVLKNRMQGVNIKLQQMESFLSWLKQRFEAENELEFNRTTGLIAGDSPERIIWTQTTEDILTTWIKVIANTAESFITAQKRRQTLMNDIEAIDYLGNWLKWKTENCGGTTCTTTIQVNNTRNRIFQWMYHHTWFSRNAKPLAKKPIELMDDQSDVLLGVYEKACCGETFKNEWGSLLKYTKEIVYQNPLRCDKATQVSAGTAKEL